MGAYFKITLKLKYIKFHAAFGIMALLEGAYG